MCIHCFSLLCRCSRLCFPSRFTPDSPPTAVFLVAAGLAGVQMWRATHSDTYQLTQQHSSEWMNLKQFLAAKLDLVRRLSQGRNTVPPRLTLACSFRVQTVYEFVEGATHRSERKLLVLLRPHGGTPVLGASGWMETRRENARVVEVSLCLFCLFLRPLPQRRK